VIMRTVIEFNDSRDSEVLADQDEISDKTIEAVKDRVEVLALLNADELRHCNLREDYVIWDGLSQSIVERLFHRREHLPGKDRPLDLRLSTSLGEQAKLLRNDDHRGYYQENDCP